MQYKKAFRHTGGLQYRKAYVGKYRECQNKSVEEFLVQLNAKIMGNGTQVIIGDGLADQAAAHGENFDIDLSTLFNRVGQAESNIKIGAGSKQTVLCPNGSLVFFSSAHW